MSSAPFAPCPIWPRPPGWRLASLAIAATWLCPHALATPLLDEVIVVTATRSEKALQDVPVRTEVITAEALRKQHARDLKEALEYAAGVTVLPIHGKTGYEAQIQGLDGDRVLILINGERISPSTGSTVDLTQLGVDDVKQIEIIKGAASALHGSNAMGGVINIITHDADDGVHGRIAIDAGSYGDRNREEGRRPPASHANARASWKSDQWQHEISADVRNSEGFLIESDTAQIRGEDGYKANFAARTAYAPHTKSRYKIGYASYVEDYVVADAITIPGRPALDRSEQVERHHVSAGATWQLTDQHALALSSFVERYEGISTSQIERDIVIDLGGVELQHDWINQRGDVFTYGLVLQGEQLSQLNNGVSELEQGEQDRRAVEAFFQYDWFATDRWEVLPGVRYIHDDQFGDHVSPKLSLMFSDQSERAQHRIRFSYGNGFRVPDLKERYFVFDHSHLGYMVLGNPDLQPEQSHSLQLGYEHIAEAGWQIDANLFHNRITDLIQTRPAGFNGSVALYEYGNIERARTQGVELNGNWSLTDNTSLRSSYTWLDTENLNTGKELTQRPRHLVKAGIGWRVFQQAGDLLVQYLYQSQAWYDEANSLRSPAWDRYDIRYTHALGQQLSLYGGVENLFDEHRDPDMNPHDQRPIPGRYLYAGVSYDF